MVIDKKTYKNILSNPEILSYTDSIELEKILDSHPFFQSALVLYVKLLKDHNILHNSKLYKAAALTTDRSTLFAFLENIRDFSTKQAQPEKKPRKETKKEDNKTDALKTKTDDLPQKKKAAIAKKEKTAITGKKMTYSQWLKYISETGQKKSKKQDPIFELIDRFIKDKPKIVPKKNYTADPPESVIRSVEEKQMLMTETLANLYLKQKKYEKAIQAFKILSLKYPKKSSYFANRIQEIKKQSKK